MTTSRFQDAQRDRLDRLIREHGRDEALILAAGGDFLAVGELELSLLKQHGLMPAHTLVDVGCGSGRLALQLRDYLTGRYVGVDVLGDLVDFAERVSDRTDWTFHSASGLSIPEPDNSADMVCCFALFTHLSHGESYRYLQEAARVLKPGGSIVFSFLDLTVPSHWTLFEKALSDTQRHSEDMQFISHDTIAAWAKHCPLTIETIHDGGKPHILLDEPVYWEDGRVMTGLGSLGQSICVLRKP